MTSKGESVSAVGTIHPMGGGVVAVAVCRGTTKKGLPCTMPAAEDSDYCYLHDPDPAVAARRRRNASRAATLGNSRIGAEIRSTRLLVRNLVEMTVSNELHPLVRKRLTEIAQLLQVYCRLAELELAAGEVPKFPGKDYAALPEDTAEKAREWADGEETKVREREELLAQVDAMAEVYGFDAAGYE